MGLQRLLHPPWALESETATSSMGSGVRDCYILNGLRSRRVTWKERHQVPSLPLWGCCQLLCSTAGCIHLLLCLPLSLSLWGSHQVKESCHFAPPQSVSVFIFVCLHLHLPASSSTYIIIHPPMLLTAYLTIFLHLCPSLW